MSTAEDQKSEGHTSNSIPLVRAKEQPVASSQSSHISANSKHSYSASMTSQ